MRRAAPASSEAVVSGQWSVVSEHMKACLGASTGTLARPETSSRATTSGRRLSTAGPRGRKAWGAQQFKPRAAEDDGTCTRSALWGLDRIMLAHTHCIAQRSLPSSVGLVTQHEHVLAFIARRKGLPNTLRPEPSLRNGSTTASRHTLWYSCNMAIGAPAVSATAMTFTPPSSLRAGIKLARMVGLSSTRIVISGITNTEGLVG